MQLGNIHVPLLVDDAGELQERALEAPRDTARVDGRLVLVCGLLPPVGVLHAGCQPEQQMNAPSCTSTDHALQHGGSSYPSLRDPRSALDEVPALEHVPRGCDAPPVPTDAPAAAPRAPPRRGDAPVCERSERASGRGDVMSSRLDLT
jgi:hypothetical protein